MAQSFTQDQINKLNAMIQANYQMVTAINNLTTIKQQFIDAGYGPGTPTTGIVDATVQLVNGARTASDLTAWNTAVDALLTTLTASSRANWKAIEAFLP